jgi:hypothetical protein
MRQPRLKRWLPRAGLKLGLRRARACGGGLSVQVRRNETHAWIWQRVGQASSEGCRTARGRTLARTVVT